MPRSRQMPPSSACRKRWNMSGSYVIDVLHRGDHGTRDATAGRRPQEQAPAKGAAAAGTTQAVRKKRMREDAGKVGAGITTAPKRRHAGAVEEPAKQRQVFVSGTAESFPGTGLPCLAPARSGGCPGGSGAGGPWCRHRHKVQEDIDPCGPRPDGGCQAEVRACQRGRRDQRQPRRRGCARPVQGVASQSPAHADGRLRTGGLTTVAREVSGAAHAASGGTVADIARRHDPSAFTASLARRDTLDLPFDAAVMPSGLPVMLDTNFYIERQRRKLPNDVAAFVESRTVLHSGVACAELAISAGSWTPPSRHDAESGSDHGGFWKPSTIPRSSNPAPRPGPKRA